MAASRRASAASRTRCGVTCWRSTTRVAGAVRERRVRRGHAHVRADGGSWPTATSPPRRRGRWPRTSARRDELHQVCSFALSRVPPAWPACSSRCCRPRSRAPKQFLGAPIADFGDACAPLHGHAINAFEPLLTRIDPKRIEAMVEASQGFAAAPPSRTAPTPEEETHDRHARTVSRRNRTGMRPATIAIDDFAKLDLRIGKVLPANSSKARTSCCASNSMPARSASGRSSPASAPATASRKSWSAATWCSSPTWRRARCASASPKA